MIEFAPGWSLAIDDAGDWLFVRLATANDRYSEPELADAVDGLARQRKRFRVIFEMAADLILHSHLVGELVMLHKRLCLQGGALRLCGFTEYNFEVIRMMQLTDRFHNFPDRQTAVAGGG
jgi:hypothetical protein